MSNPGVILLASKKYLGKNINRLDVEDNIGESIHIHINNIRIDLSIKEFLDFEKKISQSFFELAKFNGYNFDNYDLLFLFKLSSKIHLISSIYKEEKTIDDLKCIIYKYFYGFHFPFVTKITNTPHYKFLKNSSSDLLNYDQDSYYGVSNQDRILNLLKIIKKNKNFISENPIILFPGGGHIRDGLHRASILTYLGNKNSIECHIIKFIDNSDNVISLYLSFIFKLIKPLIFEFVSFFKKHIK